MKKYLALLWISLLSPLSSSAAGQVTPYYRVWGGFKGTPSHAKFMEALPAFIEGGRKFLKNHSGLAYVVAVPPAGTASHIPDELAIVVYRSKGSYREDRATPAGKAYGESHWPLFERPELRRTKSGGAIPLAGDFALNTPYDVTDKPVDWQGGWPLFFVGSIKPGTALAQLAAFTKLMRDRLGPLGMDGLLSVANTVGNDGTIDNSQAYYASWLHWRDIDELAGAGKSPQMEEVDTASRELFDLGKPFETRPLPEGATIEPETLPGSLLTVRFDNIKPLAQ